MTLVFQLSQTPSARLVLVCTRTDCPLAQPTLKVREPLLFTGVLKTGCHCATVMPPKQVASRVWAGTDTVN